MKHKATPRRYWTYDEFIVLFPETFRPSFKNLLQQSRRGSFPAYYRIGNRKSAPLWDREAVAQFSRSQFARFHPDAVSAIEKALTK